MIAPPADKPHDAFVKRILTQPEAAAVELRAALPAAVAERLDWSTLRVVPINFVDPSLDRRESDILYAIDIIDSTATRRRFAFLYVLLEHLSTPQRMAAWHFLRYITHIWERYERDQQQPIDSLPLVIPLLLFQGPDGWTEPRRLSELLDVPPELAAALPSPVELTFDVDDLHQTIEHDQLARDVIVALVEAARTSSIPPLHSTLSPHDALQRWHRRSTSSTRSWAPRPSIPCSDTSILPSGRNRHFALYCAASSARRNAGCTSASTTRCEPRARPRARPRASSSSSYSS